MKITRRKLAAALLVPAGAPAQSPAPATPAEELAAARKRVQDAIETVRKVRLDAAVEPDFNFKA
jgi:hypothetical protein